MSTRPATLDDRLNSILPRLHNAPGNAATEALLFGRCDQHAIFDQLRGRVVVEAGDAEDVHG